MLLFILHSLYNRRMLVNVFSFYRKTSFFYRLFVDSKELIKTQIINP